jgi:hypothetical protein
MSDKTTLTPVVIKTTNLDSLELFKKSVDLLLAKRSYLISKVLPEFQEGLDYYVIKGKKSLGKSGAEKLASIYSLSATFFKDEETLSMLPGHKDLIAFVCNLVNKEGTVVGQGRGIDSPNRNQNDENKTVKMAQKRAYIDAVIRTTGLSDIFTQDLEAGVMPEKEEDEQAWINNIFKEEPAASQEKVIQSELITDKQRNYVISLLDRKNLSPEDKEEYLEQANNSTKSEASYLIKELVELAV